MCDIEHIQNQWKFKCSEKKPMGETTSCFELVVIEF